MLTDKIFTHDANSSSISCPFFMSDVEAGFPSPAEDYIVLKNKHLENK